jgi:hypothetical protein
LAHEIAQASRTILAIDPSPNTADAALVWGSLEARMAAGVEYKRICTFEEMLLHGLEIKRRDVTERGVKLGVLEQEFIADKFYVIDDRSVVVFERAVGSRLGLAGQVLQNGHIARRLTKRFDRYAQDAIPALFVLDELDKAGSELIDAAAKASDSMKEVVGCIVRRGQFCRPGVAQREWAQLLERAVAAGFVDAPARRSAPTARLRVTAEEIRSSWVLTGGRGVS